MDIRTLASNPYITFASFLLTVLGVIISVINTFYKGKRELAYTIKSNEILQNVSVSGLLTRYLGRDIKDLTITYIAIWNSGSNTLRGDDIIDSNPITLSSKGKAMILNAEIVEKTDLANRVNINPAEYMDKKTITINFEDLGKKDGIILRVVHTGKASDLSMNCKIRDGKRLKSKGDICISEEKGIMDKIIRFNMLARDNKRARHAGSVFIKAIVAIACFIFSLILSVATLLVVLDMSRIIPLQDSVSFFDNMTQQSTNNSTILEYPLLLACFSCVFWIEFSLYCRKYNLPKKLKKYFKVNKLY